MVSKFIDDVSGSLSFLTSSVFLFSCFVAAEAARFC